jgi:hypothetical protein
MYADERQASHASDGSVAESCQTLQGRRSVGADVVWDAQDETWLVALGRTADRLPFPGPEAVRSQRPLQKNNVGIMLLRPIRNDDFHI